VVVYEHPLLGEGVARLVRAATGVRVEAVPGDDPAALAALLAGVPRVVIVERGRQLDDLDLVEAAPRAVVIDLSGAGCGSPVPGRLNGSGEVIEAVRSALSPVRACPLCTGSPVPEIYPSADGMAAGPSPG